MCLTLKRERKAFIAKKNITCYKHGTIKGSRFIPHHQNSFSYPIGEIVNSALDSGLLNREINRGLHSFASLKDCKKNFMGYKSGYVECIIPIGSFYHEGQFNRFKNYASNNLVIVGPVRERKR